MKALSQKTTQIALAALLAPLCAQAGTVEPAPMMTPPPSQCHWALGLELLYLEADDNGGAFDSQDYEEGFRISLDYKFVDNMGVRARWSEIEGTGSDSYKLEVYDLEAFYQFDLYGFKTEAAAGLRYAEYNEDHANLNAWGPTIGIDVSRDLGANFGLYANARASFIIGDDSHNSDATGVLVTEFGAGIQYSFNLFNSCDSTIRLGYESQIWQDMADDNDEDLELDGLVLGVNFRF